MKANPPKRKVFNDAIDLLTAEVPGNGVQMIMKMRCFHSMTIRSNYIRESGWMTWWRVSESMVFLHR